MPPMIEVVACVAFSWYVFIILVCTIGYVQLFRYYASPPKDPVVTGLSESQIPHVTVIRPCKGKEPYLYECLASTFQQTYPSHKLTVYLCVSSRQDAACHIIARVLEAFPDHDARLFVEEEDPALSGDNGSALGPNPKIRNMSRAYREAKGDLLWILDCNIWLNRGACGRMVDRLCGYRHGTAVRPFKFVHHIPVAVDVSQDLSIQQCRTENNYDDMSSVCETTVSDILPATATYFGGRLDEAFLSSAHAKMYVAINTVAVAPCICGKSSMFRRSHLNALTNKDQSTDTRFGSGIDFFSENICEDHLIGDMLWKKTIPTTLPKTARNWKNHGLVYGDIALQPVADMSVSNYVARRVRWLRVRKFTVPAATLVEPGTESFLCSVLGAFGATTWSQTKAFFGESWLQAILFWIISITVWIMVDWTVYILLQSGRSTEKAQDGQVIPAFARPLNRTRFQARRPFRTWLQAWLAREALALPVWTWAIWGGVTVVWRDKKLWVGLDMKVHEIKDTPRESSRSIHTGNGHTVPSSSDKLAGKEPKKKRLD